MAILSSANISFNTSGDNTLVTGVSGKQTRIWRLVLGNGAASDQTVLVKGTGSLGNFIMSAAKGPQYVLDGAGSGCPVFVCDSGANFLLNLSASTQIWGYVQYTIE